MNFKLLKTKIVDVLIMPSANSITITLSETPSKKSTRSIMCLKDMKVQNKSGEFYDFIVCISTPAGFHPAKQVKHKDKKNNNNNQDKGKKKVRNSKCLPVNTCRVPSYVARPLLS